MQNVMTPFVIQTQLYTFSLTKPRYYEESQNSRGHCTDLHYVELIA
jgi:hypothetical protein